MWTALIDVAQPKLMLNLPHLMTCERTEVRHGDSSMSSAQLCGGVRRETQRLRPHFHKDDPQTGH